MSWQSAPLADLADRTGCLIQTGPFGSQLHQSDYTSDGVPVIMPKDIADGCVLEDGVARVSEETARRLSRHRLAPRTIVLPRRGEVTKRLLVREEQTGWLCGTGCLQIAVNGDDLLPEYLYYFMAQRCVGEWLEQHAVGSTMLNLSAGIVGRLLVRYPSLQTQRRIAETLSAYDDLIENNRRRMTLLEDAARQLYREWFVHLRFPGHEHTRIIDGVPDGWIPSNASSAMNVLSGGTPATANSEYWGGDIPFYTPKDATDAACVISTERRITESGLKNCNSPLFPVDTLFVSARGTVGRLSLAGQPMAMSQSCYALRANGGVSQQFLYCAMSEAIEHFKQHAVGAVFDAIVVDTFKAVPFLTPAQALSSQFDDAVASAFRGIVNSLQQNVRLRAARDLLLPRLMSGEIAV